MDFFFFAGHPSDFPSDKPKDTKRKQSRILVNKSKRKKETKQKKERRDSPKAMKSNSRRNLPPSSLGGGGGGDPRRQHRFGMGGEGGGSQPRFGRGGGGGRPFTMKFFHRNEQMAWERAQRNTFTGWANYHLKKFFFLFFFLCVCCCFVYKLWIIFLLSFFLFSFPSSLFHFLFLIEMVIHQSQI